MINKHPDMLAVDKNGCPRTFGSRRHYCFSHQGYFEEAKRITGKLGKRYGSNPYILAWQTDNEYGCHDTVISYSKLAEEAFRKWLKNKYKAIGVLNEAWGNVFWSMDYSDFAEINLPYLTVTEPNPSHVMDFRRFSSDQVVNFNRAQCEKLREFTDVPLIHNYMGRITEFDHFAVGEDLEIASWDSYPLGFLEDRSDQGDDFKHDYRRQGDPDFQAFHHDLYRAVGKDRWWLMEQQPGPVNWAPYNPVPLPGMVRLWTWEAIAHGAEVVSYFRWRQAPFGQEQMHSGLQCPDGEWTDGGLEATAVSQELNLLPQFENSTSPVAIIFDYSSAWAWETQPQGKDFDYFRLVYDMYRGLRRLGLSIDILPPSTKEFGDRKFILIPGLFSWTSELQHAIRSFEGQIVIGPRSGSKTDDFKIPNNLPPNLKGFNCRIKAVESLRPSDSIALEEGGSFHIWREFLQTEETITEKSGDGQAAIVTKGPVSYLAGWPDDKAMSRILTSIAKRAGLKIRPLEAGHRRRDFSNFTLHMNYGPTSVEINDTILGIGDIQLINNSTKESLLKQVGE